MKEIIFTPPPKESIPQIRLNEIITSLGKYHAIVTLPEDPINRRVLLLIQDQIQPYGGYFWHNLCNDFITDSRQFFENKTQAILERQKYLYGNNISCNFYEFNNQQEFIDWAKKLI